jgi:hypothetical protein
MTSPTPVQVNLLDQIVEQADRWADVLREQFASCTTNASEHCPDCFTVTVPSAAPRLPSPVENPLTFDTVSARGDEVAPIVLLWHDDGRISYVEVSGFGEEDHPQLSDLTITAQLHVDD